MYYIIDFNCILVPFLAECC